MLAERAGLAAVGDGADRGLSVGLARGRTGPRVLPSGELGLVRVGKRGKAGLVISPGLPRRFRACPPIDEAEHDQKSLRTSRGLPSRMTSPWAPCSRGARQAALARARGVALPPSRGPLPGLRPPECGLVELPRSSLLSQCAGDARN
jgi:hypothetical protein